MPKRCWELDGAKRFNGRATLYALGRPSYPAAAIDYIAAHAGNTDARVVDLGAGTGISTRLLSARFPRVVAFDPNVEMARSADDLTPRFVIGRTERLPFGDEAFDLVTSFNSFHWFVPDRAMPEIDRVLAPRGLLAVVWNDWDLGDRFTARFVALMRSSARDYPPEDREAEVAPLYESGRFGTIEAGEFPNRHRLDLEGLKVRLLSMTYVPREGPELERLLNSLAELHATYADGAGLAEHHYITRVYLASR